MNRSDHYLYAQQNLSLLEQEISIVKKSAQIAIGKHAWQKEHDYNVYQLEASKREVLAATRLYTFLICSWLEARLTKILYENSSCAFTDAEIASITSNSYSMENRWKMSFSLAVRKSYSFPIYSDIIHDYSLNFTPGSLGLSNYQIILTLFSDISDAITVRNRLAHGQWDVQFNSNNTAIKHYSLLAQYDNVQKLGHLKDYFDQIGEIISIYVTYKDKHNPNFDNIIAKRIQLIMDKKSKAEHMVYSKYVSRLKNSYEQNRIRNKLRF